jgi:hypothetical protein
LLLVQAGEHQVQVPMEAAMGMIGAGKAVRALALMNIHGKSQPE